MKTRIKIEGQAQFKRDLKKYSRAIGQGVDDSIIELAVRGGRQLANITEPMGLGKKAKNIADGAIAKDVHKVYLSVPKMYHKLKERSTRKAAAFMQAHKEGKREVAERIVQATLGFETGVDGGALLKSQRTGRKGHVRDNNKASNAFDFSLVQALKKKEFESKGTAKAAWFTATKAIRGGHKKAGVHQSTPTWLRKAKGLGTSKTRKAGFNTTVSLENRTPYIRNVITAPKVRKAINNNYKYFQRRMIKEAEKARKI